MPDPTSGPSYAVEGVLFDCDGVLVDSDASVFAAWGEWAAQHSLDPDTVAKAVHGRRAADTVALLIDPEQRAEALNKINAFELESAAEVTAIPGAIQLVRAIGPDFSAVVTSGTRLLAAARLSAAGIPAVSVVITADDVINGKPDAEGYRSAAIRLGLTPENTIVFEDAASGVQAARAAGVRAVIGVGRRALGTDADIVIADLRMVTWTGGLLRCDPRGILRGLRTASD